MAGSVLHTLIEVSEHFQDVMRLAAADGILDSWGIEVVLQDVALNLREDDNFHGNLLFGLHSLLLLLARKLADLGHEVLGEVCGCGWDTSHLPESQHTDIHRYTSGTVVRWVRGECYVLLASTSSADSTTTSPEQPQDQDEHQHQQIDPSDGAPEEEEYQVTTPGEVVSPEEGTAVSGGDEDPHCCSEEAECCLASPSPQGEEPGSLEPLQQDSKGVIGVWPGCQVHSCFTNKRDEMDGGQKQHAACRVHCGQGETMKGQTIKDESQEKMEDEEVDEEEEEEEEEKEEQEQMDLGSEEEEDKKEQEQVEVSCEEEEEEEEKKEVSEQSSWSSQNDAFDMDVDMREHAANEVEEQSNNEDETDDTTSRDLQITREKEIEERPVSECSEGKEEEDEGKENDEETCTNSKDEWRGIEGVEGVEHDRSTSPLETCGVPSLVTALPCEDVEAAVVSEESLDGDSSCTLIIHEEEDTSCREDTREEDTGEDISKGSKEDLQETVLKDAMQIKENETTVQDSFREMIREDNKEIISDDSSRKDGTERNWRENKALGSCKNTFGSLREDTTLEAWSKDTTEESDKNTQEDTGKEGTAVDSCKNTQEDSWKGDNTIDSYKNTQEDTTVDSCKNTQEDSWKEDTTIDSYKNPQEHSWRENITTDGFKNTQEEKWKEDGTVETLTCNPLQNAQEVTSSNSNSSNSQPILPPHSLSLAPKEKCASSDLFGLQNPASQPSFPHTAPPIHTHYDEEEEEEDDEDDDDDVEEESDDDSSSVTSSSSTSSSSSSSSSSSDDDDRINFKQRVERAAQAAREAEASAAARLASAATQEDLMAPSKDLQPQIPPQVALPHHLEDHTQLAPQDDLSSLESSSDEMTSGEDPGGGVVGGGHGSGGISGGGSSSDGGVGVAVSGNGGVGVAVSGNGGAPAVVVTVASASAALVYVEPSVATPMSLVPPCPEPPDASLHSSRDPADLQAAQGLTDLQMGQNQGLATQSGAPLPCPVVDQMQQMPAEVRRGSGSKGLECMVCGKVFNRLLKLKQHHRTHTGERPWGCTSCSKTFSRPAYLQNHRLSCHTPAHQRQYSCYVCQRGFGLKSSLQAHLVTHATNKPFTCDICGQTFALKFTRDTHKAQHTGSRPWVCSVCGRSYVTKYKLRAHMKAHTGELVCSFCGRQFTSQDSLGRHRRLHEGSASKTEPMLPSCSICNKKFATPSLLKRHIASHERQSAVKCGVCSQEFSNHQQLTAHQTRHHHQQQHQNHPLHQCPVCSKVYVQEVYLTRHMATHTTFPQQTGPGRPLPPPGPHPKETVGGGQPSPNISNLQQPGTSIFQQSQTEPSLDNRLSRQDSYLTAAQHQLDPHPQQHLLSDTANDRTQTQQVFLNYNTEILEDAGFRATQPQD